MVPKKNLQMWLLTLAGLACAGCDDSSDAPGLEGDGASDGAGDGSDGAGDGVADGSADGEADGSGPAAAGCGKGEYDSTGTTTVCPTGNDCIPASDIEGYELISGNLFYIDQTSLEPLRCLETTGQLAIDGVLEATDLDALSNLSDVYSLDLLNMESLSDFSGLANVASVDTLGITRSPLATVTGVPPIEVALFMLSRAEELTSLAGFEPLAITEKIVIQKNPKLPQCEVERFAALYPGVELSSSENDDGATCN
jgi:hypothetical protein